MHGGFAVAKHTLHGCEVNSVEARESIWLNGVGAFIDSCSVGDKGITSWQKLKKHVHMSFVGQTIPSKTCFCSTMVLGSMD